MEFEKGHAILKIYTDDLAIVGKVLVTEREYRKGRLSDYLNREDILFIPVHEAYIFSLETKKPISNKVFILLNKHKINWLIPIKEPGEKGPSEPTII